MSHRTRWIVLYQIFITTTLFAQSQINMEPITLNDYHQKYVFQRSVYSINSTFTSKDTLYFLEKPENISITAVDSVSRYELLISFQIDSGFVHFKKHLLTVVDENKKQKATAQLDIRYNNIPYVNRVNVYQKSVKVDTVKLTRYDKSFASAVFKGTGLFPNTTFEFDDPAVSVLNDPGWRLEFCPDSIRVGLEINNNRVQLGLKMFRIKNQYTMEGTGQIFIRSAFPPKLFTRIPALVADGNEKSLKLYGENFKKGMTAHLLPNEGMCNVNVISENQMDLQLNLPVLDSGQSYRLVLVNPDGQADTTRYFTVKSKPLSIAKINSVKDGRIFYDRDAHIIITVQATDRWNFKKDKNYEVNIEGERFPVLNVINDTTCEASIRVREKPSQLLHQHVFTINEIDQLPKWKGILTAHAQPKITYISTYRILHPVDTLSIVIKGENLKNAVLRLDEPDVFFQIKENRGDLIRATVIAGDEAAYGEYPLHLVLDGVTFISEQNTFKIEKWQDFSEFVGIETTSLGFIASERLWKSSGLANPIKARDAIEVKFFTRKLKEKLGTQKILISGVLMDSSLTIKGEAFDKKLVRLSKENDVYIWRWRAKEKIKSGDRIEITLSNPGNQNKVTEILYAKPHWFESFHGSTSIVLFKIPFGGSNSKTEILKSIGIGLTYQPPNDENEFIAFDASFIIGNINSDDSDLSVDVGLGLSTILWKYIQIGLGMNLSGDNSGNAFMFVGSRFNLPFNLGL